MTQYLRIELSNGAPKMPEDKREEKPPTLLVNAWEQAY